MKSSYYLYFLALLSLLPPAAVSAADPDSTSHAPIVLVDPLADSSMPSIESILESAQRAYSEAQYPVAVELYSAAIDQAEAPSAALYYDLGAAHFKAGDLAEALLSFKRAERLAPHDPDIRHNLHITRSRTIDQISTLRPSLWSRFANGLMHLLPLRGWMSIALLLFALAMLGGLAFRFAPKRDHRLYGFYSGIALLLLSVVANLMVYRAHRFLYDTSEAVVTASTVTVKSSPDLSSRDVMVVHAGMEIRVLQQLGLFAEVRLPDGSKGWIENSAFKTVRAGLKLHS